MTILAVYTKQASVHGQKYIQGKEIKEKLTFSRSLFGTTISGA